jgi:8-oxo-dGTP pyrophosphatase MutT (NUDIX family)
MHKPSRADQTGPLARALAEEAAAERAARALAGAVPAATTVLLRDGRRGLETLMLRRTAGLDFAAGMWVFPGGRIDPEDVDPARPDDEETTARRAAAREAREEADLEIDVDTLVLLSRWCPPPEAPRRFNTWFFVGPAPVGAVTVDGGEIDDHLWIRPTEAIERRHRGVIQLVPPTWITLQQISPFRDVAEAMAAIRSWTPALWATRMFPGRHRTLVWEPDVAHASGVLHDAGPRNRLVMSEDGWVYERSG